MVEFLIWGFARALCLGGGEQKVGWQVCSLPLGAREIRVAISPDGKRVVTGASEETGDVQIWDVETAAQVRSWVEV